MITTQTTAKRGKPCHAQTSPSPSITWTRAWMMPHSRILSLFSLTSHNRPMLPSAKRPGGSSSIPLGPDFVDSVVCGLEPTEGDDVGRKSPFSAALSPALPRDPGREEAVLPRDTGRAGGRDPPRDSLRERDGWPHGWLGVLKGGLMLPLCSSEMVSMPASDCPNQVEAGVAVEARLPLREIMAFRSGQAGVMLSARMSERISTPPTFPR